MPRSDYAHWNEEQDRVWWQEEGRFDGRPDPADHYDDLGPMELDEPRDHDLTLATQVRDPDGREGEVAELIGSDKVKVLYWDGDHLVYSHTDLEVIP